MRRRLEVSNTVAAELAGSEDRILRSLEGHVEAEVFLRGNVVTLDGEEGDVDAAALVVSELSELIEGGHEIAEGTIAAVTDALAGALQQRGAAESGARLLAHVGAAIFQTAFERWTDQPEHAGFSACVREATAELASSLGAVDIPAWSGRVRS